MESLKTQASDAELLQLRALWPVKLEIAWNMDGKLYVFTCIQAARPSKSRLPSDNTHPPPDARLQLWPPSLRLFFLFIFSLVSSKCRRGLLASMERFGGRPVMVWVSFLWLFGSKWDLWNVCFTIVKPYFLRSGEVLVPDLFTLCFCIVTFTLFSSELCGFVDPQGVHGVPNVSLCSLWCPPVAGQIGVRTTSELPFGLQGCQMGQNGAKSALRAFKMCQKLTKNKKTAPQKLHAFGLNMLRFCTFNVRIHFQSNILIVCTFDS